MQIVKPQVPTINWNNPLTKGLIFDSGFFEKGGTKTIELTHDLTGTIDAAGATWEENLYGHDLDFSAAASRITYTSPAYMNTMKGPVSFEFLTLIRSAGAGGLGKIAQKTSGTTDTGTYYNLRLDSSTNQLWLISGFATTASGGSCSFVPDSKWHHWVITCSNIDVLGPTYKIYKDGVSQTLAANNAGSGAKPADDTNFYIGNRSNSNRNFDGKMAYFRIWNTVLRPQSVTQLYLDPFRIYNRPRKKQLG